MKVTLWMATSLNGMAARENGAEDFLSAHDWDLFVELVGASESLVWGRVTHELFIGSVRQLFPELIVVVVTRDPVLAVDSGTARAASPEQAIAELVSRGATSAILAGGPRLNGAFAAARLIDEVILGVEPVLVTSGLPMVVGEAPDLRLALVEVDDRRRPTLCLRYRVVGGPD
jgi:riboflavin biosynthesis pyrimidine reductase